MMYDENKQFYSSTDSFLEGVWDWAITWEQTRLRKQFKLLAQHTHECTLTELSSHLHGKPVLQTQATSHYVHIETDKPEKTDTFTLGVQLGCYVFSLDWQATTKLKLDKSILHLSVITQHSYVFWTWLFGSSIFSCLKWNWVWSEDQKRRCCTHHCNTSDRGLIHSTCWNIVSITD